MAEFRIKTLLSTRTSRKAALFGVGIGLLACLLLVLAPNGAEAKTNKRAVLGANKVKVTPNCGTKAVKRACIAEGKVTGFQALQRGVAGRSFIVPFRRGKVAAWSITLANPTHRDTEKYGGAQLPYFNALFGSPSKARISILRQVQKSRKGPPRYKLIRASGTQTLNPYFGTTVKFAITKPLNVIKGDVVALTIPTWAPAFWVPLACNEDSDGNLINAARCASARKSNTWRASRAGSRCAIGTDARDRPNEALEKSRPQQRVNSIRQYGCYYTGGRLLYTATVVSR